MALYETFVPLIDSCFTHSRFTISHCSDFKLVFTENIVSPSEQIKSFVQARWVLHRPRELRTDLGSFVQEYLNLAVTRWVLYSLGQFVEAYHVSDRFWDFLIGSVSIAQTSGISYRWCTLNNLGELRLCPKLFKTVQNLYKILNAITPKYSSLGCWGYEHKCE